MSIHLNALHAVTALLTEYQTTADRVAALVEQKRPIIERYGLKLKGYEVYEVWLKKYSADKLKELDQRGIAYINKKVFHPVLMLEVNGKEYSIGYSMANKTVSYIFHGVLRFYKLHKNESEIIQIIKFLRTLLER